MSILFFFQDSILGEKKLFLLETEITLICIPDCRQSGPPLLALAFASITLAPVYRLPLSKNQTHVSNHGRLLRLTFLSAVFDPFECHPEPKLFASALL